MGLYPTLGSNPSLSARLKSVATVVVARIRKLAWAFYLLAFVAAAHTWTFNQDGSIETQNGTWTFKKGGRMDAELQRMKGSNVVVLRRMDGTLCEVPLAVLSEKDRDFVLHPPEDARIQEKTRVDEAGKIERYWRSHALNVIDDIDEPALPASAQSQEVCREIVECMRQLTNVLDSALAYTNFCDLLQKQAVAVEKAKETGGASLPRSFLHHTDEFFRFMTNSRDEWSDELKGESPEYKEYRAFLRNRGWAQAKVHFLYCAVIAEKTPGVVPQIIEAEAAIIQSEQQLARQKQNGSPYPLLHAMNLEEISERLRSERAAALTRAN